MENSAETSPLINEYKLQFVKGRLPQTVLGGPIFYVGQGQRLPWYIYMFQFIIFISPIVSAAIFTIPVELGLVDPLWMSISCGLVSTTYLIVSYLSIYSKKSTTLQKFDEDSEDEVEFQGCADLRTILRFIIYRKGHVAFIISHATFYGVINGFVFWYLLPSVGAPVFRTYNGSIVYHCFGWISSCIGLYSLIARPPAEPCQFRATSSYEITAFTRPSHMACIIAFEVATRLIMSHELSHLLLTASFMLRIVFACLPLFWIFGILPPIDCLFSWLGEIVHVHLFGGSAMSNNLRLLVMLSLSSIGWLISYGILHHLTSVTGALTVATCFGFILSMDITSGLEHLYWKVISPKRKCERVEKPSNTASYSWFKFLYFGLMLFLIGFSVALAIEHQISDNQIIDSVGYAVLAIFVVDRFCGNMLTLYLFFGLVSNPIFFALRKGYGKIFLSCLRKIITNFVFPLGMVAFITITATKYSNSFGAADELVFTLLAFRGYRLAWQNPHRCALDVSVFMVIRSSSLNIPLWNQLPIHTQLFFISLLVDRFQCTWNLLSFSLRFIYKFFFNRKVRHQSYKRVAILMIVLFPFLAFMFCLSILFYAPLLPIFTLPIFLIGYPRPTIFWPYGETKVSSSSNDWIYYRQLMPSLLNGIKEMISSGSLGDVRPGEHFLARFQDRLIWFFVAEKGFLHTNAIAKGLELAETSCHTVEAGRIDDIFETVLGDKPRPTFNPYPSHCLVPCDLLVLDAYSDAKNVLTGIIDSPENQSMLLKHFLKSLTWVLLRFSKARRDRGLSDGPTVEELKVKYEAKQQGSRHEFLRLSSNETKETLVIGRNDDVEELRRDQSLSSQSKSSLSENSMTALWNNREPLKLVPLKSSNSQSKDATLPPLDIASKKSTKEGFMKRNSFKGPNLVGDDDFDDFDDFDDDLPRASSVNSAENIESNAESKTITGSFTEKSSTHAFEPAMQNQRLSKPNTLPSLKVDVSSPHSSMLEPPLRWKNSIPVEASDISVYQDEFSEEWFKFVLSKLALEANGERVLQSVSADRGLFFIFRRLVLSCYFVINEQQQRSALDIWKMFSGVLPWSRYWYWIEQDTELQKQVVMAYRYAFKLMYDEAVLGPIDDFEEFAEYLLDYEENWHMGNDNDQQWVDAVLDGVPNLLSVGYDKENGKFTSRVLSKQKMKVPIGRLDSENVKAIWSSLSLELLYFTNDDEERYSIQAHPSLLRNLTIQAAHPPFGYPVYSSGLLNIVGW